MLGIGFYAWNRTEDLADYILGGRRLSAKVAALSAGASDMSGWLLLGLPGAIYVGGARAGLIGFGLFIGAYLNWKIVAPRLRVLTEHFGDSLTIPDYFANRFDDKAGVLRLISAAVILLFFTFYTASGMVAGAKLFSHTFGMEYQMALWIGAGVIVSYTFLGGFLAVSWTDFIQGILMLLALIIAPLVVIYELQGFSQTLHILDVASNNLIQAEEITYSLLEPFSGLTVISALSMLAWGFGYYGQPHILARFMAIEHVSKMAKARRIAMSWMGLALLGSITTGFVGIAWFQIHPEMGFAALNQDPEAVFILLTKVVFNPWVAGILLAAILAAVMSTIDSQLLVCSSAITEDFYRGLISPEADDKTLVWVGRISVVALAVVAIFIASNPDAGVLQLVSYAWAGLGSAFGPLILFSVLWDRMNHQGALAGIITGAVVVVIWKNLSGGPFDVFELYEMFPAFLLSGLAIYLVTRATAVPERKLKEKFNRALLDLE
jgi:sodium/proline symporter